MNAEGVVRRIDKLGRIVIPVEFRKSLSIQLGEEVEIMLEGNTVVLQKHEERCVFCGSSDNLEMHISRQVCMKCKDKILSSYNREM